MLGGTLALVERSLRIDAKSRWMHLIRLGMMVAVYVALCSAVATESLFGAPGLRFFQSIVYVDLALLTLTGIGFFSTTITEEKEEDTFVTRVQAPLFHLNTKAKQKHIHKR